ncbi:alpha-tocopherol transfer protein [Manduca sexta]|uniref:alpha-tocopherol transfer protein n=1 Tax=Manduca sexta TaxID=7130 RepID=UPI0018906538|nr:alpha-tocopherol transfer protein [Manduca sexta]XP_037292769.1 alpha-tocopherol transfer protein [Manduca sexta]XP_037292770.1 alpha-tocopherol transfer protein [Manduca sexta]XP_037292771.1 alpha-tocopherol transfer protein [Manduca sexta]
MEDYVARSFPLEEEYKKPTGITPQDIAQLRQWLVTQPHLPHERITDLDLILSFHSCKRCMESTKKLLDTHYTMKTTFHAIFKDRVVDAKIQLALERALLKPLPARTKAGDAIFYSRLLDLEPRNFMLKETMRAVLMILELWQYEEGTWPGLVILYDLEGLRLGHLLRLEREVLKQFLAYLEQSILVKIKEIHLLNAPYFVDKLIALVHKFIRCELFSVLKIHQTGTKTLGNYIDVSILPKEAGGNYKTYEECKDETMMKIMANRGFFENELKKRANLALRPKTIRYI